MKPEPLKDKNVSLHYDSGNEPSKYIIWKEGAFNESVFDEKKFHFDDDIQNAVEWLKEEINVRDANETTAIFIIDILTKIDKAFEDVIKK